VAGDHPGGHGGGGGEDVRGTSPAEQQQGDAPDVAANTWGAGPGVDMVSGWGWLVRCCECSAWCVHVVRYQAMTPGPPRVRQFNLVHAAVAAARPHVRHHSMSCVHNSRLVCCVRAADHPAVTTEAADRNQQGPAAELPFLLRALPRWQTLATRAACQCPSSWCGYLLAAGTRRS